MAEMEHTSSQQGGLLLEDPIERELRLNDPSIGRYGHLNSLNIIHGPYYLENPNPVPVDGDLYQHQWRTNVGHMYGPYEEQGELNDQHFSLSNSFDTTDVAFHSDHIIDRDSQLVGQSSTEGDRSTIKHNSNTNATLVQQHLIPSTGNVRLPDLYAADVSNSFSTESGASFETFPDASQDGSILPQEPVVSNGPFPNPTNGVEDLHVHQQQHQQEFDFAGLHVPLSTDTFNYLQSLFDPAHGTSYSVQQQRESPYSAPDTRLDTSQQLHESEDDFLKRLWHSFDDNPADSSRGPQQRRSPNHISGSPYSGSQRIGSQYQSTGNHQTAFPPHAFRYKGPRSFHHDSQPFGTTSQRVGSPHITPQQFGSQNQFSGIPHGLPQVSVSQVNASNPSSRQHNAGGQTNQHQTRQSTLPTSSTPAVPSTTTRGMSTKEQKVGTRSQITPRGYVPIVPRPPHGMFQVQDHSVNEYTSYNNDPATTYSGFSGPSSGVMHTIPRLEPPTPPASRVASPQLQSFGQGNYGNTGSRPGARSCPTNAYGSPSGHSLQDFGCYEAQGSSVRSTSSTSNIGTQSTGFAVSGRHWLADGLNATVPTPPPSQGSDVQSFGQFNADHDRKFPVPQSLGQVSAHDRDAFVLHGGSNDAYNAPLVAQNNQHVTCPAPGPANNTQTSQRIHGSLSGRSGTKPKVQDPRVYIMHEEEYGTARGPGQFTPEVLAKLKAPGKACQKRNCKKHKQSHWPIGEYGNIECCAKACEICGEEFGATSSVRRHVRVKHVIGCGNKEPEYVKIYKDVLMACGIPYKLMAHKRAQDYGKGKKRKSDAMEEDDDEVDDDEEEQDLEEDVAESGPAHKRVKTTSPPKGKQT